MRSRASIALPPGPAGAYAPTWKKSTPIGALDMMIGAHALTLGLALASDNVREFSRVKGLTVVDWLAGKH